jgi:RNA polymerase sigma-70 factor, ECF subfamily
MNPYGRLHSGNEWSRSPFLIHEDLLVSAAVAGQDEAFVELCRRTSGRALTAIYRITQNRKDARDVSQESISIALLHLNQFKPASSFSTWLTRIGINCALIAASTPAHARRESRGSRAYKSRSAVCCSIQIL